MSDVVLVIGYGSIGKRHVGNLLSLGYSPCVLTKHPTRVLGQTIRFITNPSECSDAEYGIIATPTGRHLDDFISLITNTNVKYVLIEKPVEKTLLRALEIRNTARDHDVNVFVAYNLRFLKIFDVIREAIQEQLDKIRLVKISAGQYLPTWRPYKDYRESYSAYRELGGGVDLDLSHEIDYMLWLFGHPVSTLSIIRDKISDLEIYSPDYFKGIYRYADFVVDVELDYIRSKERYFQVIGENSRLLMADFVNNLLEIRGTKFQDPSLFDIDITYIEELKEFLGWNQITKLASLEEGIDVLRYLHIRGEGDV